MSRGCRKFKTCAKCRKRKLLPDFYKNDCYTDGYSSRCKVCLRQASREYSLSYRNSKTREHPDWPIIHCDFCGSPFRRSPAILKNSKNHFCDQECMKAWRAKHWWGKNHPTYQNDRIFVRCFSCGERLQRREAHLLKCERSFCSPKCWGQWASSLHVGSPAWNRDLTKETNEGLRSAGEKHKELWQEPEWRMNQVQAIMKGSCAKPNRSEQKLNELLQEAFPRQFVLNVSGRLVIGGKVPDFVDAGKHQKLIELFGNYWHSRPGSRKKDFERLAIFQKAGYQVLVVWEHELKDEKILKRRIDSFSSGTKFWDGRLSLCSGNTKTCTASS